MILLIQILTSNAFKQAHGGRGDSFQLTGKAEAFLGGRLHADGALLHVAVYPPPRYAFSPHTVVDALLVILYVLMLLFVPPPFFAPRVA